MRNSPPAIPSELRVWVHVYGKVKDDQRSAAGQKGYTYKLRRTVLVKESRQRANSDTAAHIEREQFFSRFIGNWWEFADVKNDDVIVVKNNRAQFGLIGPVVNWEQRNRWAVIDAVSDMQCRKADGIDSCNC